MNPSLVKTKPDPVPRISLGTGLPSGIDLGTTAMFTTEALTVSEAPMTARE